MALWWAINTRKQGKNRIFLWIYFHFQNAGNSLLGGVIHCSVITIITNTRRYISGHSESLLTVLQKWAKQRQNKLPSATQPHLRLSYRTNNKHSFTLLTAPAHSNDSAHTQTHPHTQKIKSRTSSAATSCGQHKPSFRRGQQRLLKINSSKRGCNNVRRIEAYY